MTMKLSSSQAFNLEKAKIVSSGLRVNTFPKRQNLESSKPKEFADDNFEFDENGGQFS